MGRTASMCRDCKERHIACHSNYKGTGKECIEYKNFKLLNNRKLKRKQENREFEEYLVSAISRMKG